MDKLTLHAKPDTELFWKVCLMFVLAMVVMSIPESALAGGPDNIGNMICEVAKWFTGKIGQGIATVAIIVIGLGALMGKVSWGMAILVAIGIGIIFGAGAIVNALGHGASGC